MTVTDAELKRFARLADDFPGVGLVYVFGSRARGTASATSDWDVAVLLDRVSDELRVRFELESALAEFVGGDSVDLILLNSASIELAYAVIATGARVYERDVVTRVEYEARVLSLYMDFLPVLRQYRDDVIRGGRRATRVRWHREALDRAGRALRPAPGPQKQTPS